MRISTGYCKFDYTSNICECFLCLSVVCLLFSPFCCPFLFLLALSVYFVFGFAA